MNDVIDAGVFLVDKPAGISSFKVVARMRRIFGIKKVGHAGTLDPFATGLLVVCVGRPATRLISSFMDGDKEYSATLRLGIETTTQDPEGEIVRESVVERYTDEQIEDALSLFRGEQLQSPPAYSALKHKGKPLYYYARKGIEVKKEPRLITVHELTSCGMAKAEEKNPELSIHVRCSKGTYIRVLGAEIGKALGCGAYLSALRRTASGCFSVSEALAWEDLVAENAKELCLEKMLSVEEASSMVMAEKVS